MDKDNRSRAVWGHYLLVIILFCAIVFSFAAFARDNRTRILEQNQTYAHDVALRAASRVEDMLEARSTTLNLLSITVAETIKEPGISPDFLKLLQDTSVFDYVEFIDLEGLNHNAVGQTSDSTDRGNYLQGIQGETGFHVIYNSRITNETLVNFFAPVRYEGEIIGVLNGMFREESLRQAISVKFFDADAKSLICAADGSVISAYGYELPVGNLLEGLAQDKISSEAALADIQAAFADRSAKSFFVQGADDKVCVSLAPISGDWMLVQTFPQAVTRQMQAIANSTGMKLELQLVGIFLIYVAYLLATNLRKRRQLTSEKVRLSSIVEGLVPLFTRLVIIEPDQQRYEYLKGAPAGLPARGDVSLLGQSLYTRYIPQEGAEVCPTLEDIKAALGAGAPFLQYEYRIGWEEERWENASVLSLRQKDGVPVSLIFAIQDVTALQRQKDSIQQTLRDAFHAAEDLSHAKSDFLARMSHNMRTPMNAVLGLASIALANLEDEALVRDCLEKLEASGQQLLGLINEILDMSKIESGGMMLDEVEFDLTAAVEQVAAEFESVAAAKQLRLDIAIAPLEHRAVLGDPQRLQQVLRNLLDNALKYTPAGGAVSFGVRELPSQALKSGYFEFVVEDTGIGIEPELLPRIFDPFVSGEFCRDSLGTGLGLSIAQTIVKLMSGDLKAESQPGQGAKFIGHVFLKLPQGAAAGSAASEEAPPAAGAKPVCRHAGRRVLLVDDIAINMLVVRKMLETAGILVETAENGAEAVALVQSQPPGYYDLIFMDLQMPVLDGYGATRAIRGMGRDDLLRLPIVAVTANSFQEDVSQAKEAGMNDLVKKPVDLARLLAALDQWLPG